MSSTTSSDDSKIAHRAVDHDLTFKEVVLQLGLVRKAIFDRVVDPAKMVKPYAVVAARSEEGLYSASSTPAERREQLKFVDNGRA